LTEEELSSAESEADSDSDSLTEAEKVQQAVSKQLKKEETKRLRMAQEIQRQLQEVGPSFQVVYRLSTNYMNNLTLPVEQY